VTDPVETPGEESDAPRTDVRRAARERAQQLRVLQRRKDRRTTWLLRGAVIGGIAVALGIVAIALVNFIQPPGRGPQNMLSDGIRFSTELEPVRTGGLGPGDAPVATETTDPNAIDIRIYVDYLSATAGDFERTNGEQIRTWVESGLATVEIHPIATLTGQSAGTQYSSRAANAAACVAEFAPASFYAYNELLLLDQPVEGEAGFEDSELIRRAEQAGAGTSTRLTNCIESVRFKTWVQEATDRAVNGPLPGTDLAAVSTIPTVLVNGQQYQYVGEPDPDEFARFIVQIGGSAFNQESTETPEPTEEPSEEPADE